MKCPLVSRCWRHSYSCYVKQGGAANPLPERLQMFNMGYATAEMMKPVKNARGKTRPGGIYMEIEDMCPELEGYDYHECFEFKKHNNKRPVRGASKVARAWLPRQARRNVARRDKYICHYCLRHISVLKRLGIKCHIDHYVPRALGGSDDESNLVFSCKKCNEAKGTAIWEKGQNV